MIAADEILTFPSAKGDVRVQCFASQAEAGAHVAGRITAALGEAITRRGHALWIGCGGTTPKPVYQELVKAPLDWSKITLGQVDERFVPVNDAASNTRMMREALSSVLDRMDFVSLVQDDRDLATCAARAEAKMLELGDGEPPVFDFALMGMGPDAHYASIFPGHPINAFVYDTHALVVPVKATHNAAEPVLPRLTLSVPALNRSRAIVFYITGQTKLDVLKKAATSTDAYASPIGAFLAQCPVPVDFVWAA